MMSGISVYQLVLRLLGCVYCYLFFHSLSDYHSTSPNENITCDNPGSIKLANFMRPTRSTYG